MQVAYLTLYNVQNPASWDRRDKGNYGSSYSLAKNLEKQGIDLDYLGPFPKKNSLTTKIKWEIYRKFFHQDYYRWAEPAIFKDYARKISAKLATTDSQIILCPENGIALHEIQDKRPIVLYTDTTLGALINYYSWLGNLCRETQENLYKLEKSALERCDFVLFTSDWAADQAKEIYSLSAAKIRIVERGANIDCDRSIEDVKILLNAREKTSCKLLFIGVDWQRKGGDIALKVTQKLNELGLKTTLTVIGCTPPANLAELDCLQVLGYLNKSNPQTAKQYNQILSESHFLILPTQADCSPNVLIEANSWGVPGLATQVGGIPTLIQDHVNGKTFALDADIVEYTQYIHFLMTHYDEYEKLALTAFNEYKSRLNWTVIAKKMQQILSELIR